MDMIASSFSSLELLSFVVAIIVIGGVLWTVSKAYDDDGGAGPMY